MKMFALYGDITNIQNVFKTVAQIFGFTHIKTEDKVFISVCAQTFKF